MSLNNSGIESIIQKITEDAQKKAGEIIQKAQNEAQNILGRADEEIKQMQLKSQSEAQAAAASRAQRITAGAQLDGKKEYLKTKQDIIDEAFQRAVASLASLSDNDYDTLIKKMTVGVSGVTQMLPRDREKGTGGGFIALNGKVELNYSFEALAKNAKEKLEQKLVEILF